MTSLPACNTKNSYSDTVARNFVGRQCRQSKCQSTVSVDRQCQSLMSAIDVGLCVTGIVMLNKFEFVIYTTNKSFGSSMNSKYGATAHCSVLFIET